LFGVRADVGQHRARTSRIAPLVHHVRLIGRTRRVNKINCSRVILYGVLQ
jgi:hypothetical protein